MPFEPHEKARFLLDRTPDEQISRDVQRWLDAHLNDCAECGRYAALTNRAIRALNSFSFDPDPASALQTQDAIRNHVERLAAAESQAHTLLIGFALAMLLTIAGSVLVWQTVSWLAPRLNLPAPVWRTAFALMWLLPSFLVSGLPLFRNRLLAEDSSDKGERV